MTYDEDVERVAEARPTWVCDGCMTRVTRDHIKDMADGEHVLCQVCWSHERHGQPCEHGSYVTQSDGDYCASCHVKLPAASCR